MNKSSNNTSETEKPLECDVESETELVVSINRSYSNNGKPNACPSSSSRKSEDEQIPDKAEIGKFLLD